MLLLQLVASLLCTCAHAWNLGPIWATWTTCEHQGYSLALGQLEMLLNDASTAAQVHTTLGMSGLGLHGHVGWWLPGLGLLEAMATLG